MARLRGTAAVVLLIALAGCGRCGGPGAAKSAEELLPAQPPGAASTVALGQLAKHAEDLLARAGKLSFGEQLTDYRKGVAAQLGFDPLTREGLLAAGLDPDRGAALVLGAGGARTGFVAALPLSSEGAFTQTFERLARERGGYAERTEVARGGVKVVVFARAGAAQELGYAVVRGYGVVARGDDPAADIAAAQARTAAQSLAGDARFAAARAALAGPDLLLYARAQSGLQARLLGAPLPGDTALGISGSARGVLVRASLALAAPDAHEVSALLPGGGDALAALLPRDAPLLLRLGIAPAQLPAQLAHLPQLAGPLSQLRDALVAKKVDLDKDLFGALQPGAVASLSLSPRADLARAVDASALDFRHHSPFDVVQLAAYARPADEPRLVRALQAVADVLPQFGATATRAAGGAAEWQVSYAGGEGARFGVRSVDGAQLAYLLGGTTLDEALARRGAQGAGGKDAAALQADLGALAAQVRALPQSAYGAGPQSYVARSLVGQVIEPLHPFVVHATVTPGPAGVLAELSIDIAADAP